MNKTITMSRVARWFGVSKGTVRRWSREGKIKKVGIGYNREALFEVEAIYKLERKRNIKEL
jgi:predicted site-specific integrase-resolvase